MVKYHDYYYGCCQYSVITLTAELFLNMLIKPINRGDWMVPCRELPENNTLCTSKARS